MMRKVLSEPDHAEVIQTKSSDPCHHSQNWNVSVTAVVKCPVHDNNSICGYEFPVDVEFNI